MGARDELQMTIFRSNRLNTQIDLQSDRRLEGSQLAWAGYAATAIRAAGYRKPRTITTVQELDALEDGAVVAGDWATYQRVLGRWVTLGGPAVVTVDLPATVLHEAGA